MPKYILFFFSLFLLSCNNEDIDSVSSIVVKSNARQVFLGDSFEFNVTTDTNVDITSEVIINVNGENITGSNYTPTELGFYNIKAIYNGLESEVIQVESVEPSIYSHKVLIEDYTGVWCGYCPRIAHSIELLKEQTDKVVSVAVHLYDHNDMYSFSGSTLLNNTFAIGGLPEGRINRTDKWSYPENTNLDQVLNAIDLGSPLGIAINSSISGNQINATLRIGFDKTLTENLGLVVYLTENGLIHDQTNYTNFYQGDPVVDFVHNEVLREIYTDVNGETIPSDETVEGNIYSLDNLVYDIPISVEDNSKLHLVAFVVDRATNKVINVQEALVGENKDFD